MNNVMNIRRLRRMLAREPASRRLASVIGTSVWFVSSFLLWEILGDLAYRLLQSQFAAYMACGVIGGILGVLAGEVTRKLWDKVKPSN